MTYFVLHKDLFSVRGYAGHGQVSVMEKFKHTRLTCLGWVNGVLFFFAGKKKKKSFNKSALRRCLSANGGSNN